MTVVVDYQPWPVGYTYAYFDLTFATKNGPETFPNTIDLSKFTLYFRTLTGVETAGTGSFLMVALSPAELFYKPSVADVTTMNGSSTNGVFNGTVFIVALMPPSFTTADEAVWGPVPFNITARGA